MERDFRIAQIRAFATVAKTGSYTKAAEELSFSEPGIYLQVKALEKNLGVTLLERRGPGRDLRLTAAAIAIGPQIAELMERASDLFRAVDNLGLGCRIRVGAGRHTGPYRLMPMLKDFAVHSPADSIELHVLGPYELVAGLVDGELDIVAAGTLARHIDGAARKQHNIVMVPWLREEWVLVGPNDDAGRAVPRNESVFVGPYLEHKRAAIEGFLVEQLREQVRVFVLESPEAVRSAVENRLGLGVVPRRSISQQLASDALRIVLDPGARGGSAIDLVHKRARLLSPPARRFLRFAIQSRHHL
jgi:DNA-binding transcriptional LysR family regulator